MRLPCDFWNLLGSSGDGGSREVSDADRRGEQVLFCGADAQLDGEEPVAPGPARQGGGLARVRPTPAGTHAIVRAGKAGEALRRTFVGKNLA